MANLSIREQQLASGMATDYQYSFRQMVADIKYDLERYQFRLSRSWIVLLFLFPGLQALIAYRVSHWLDVRHKLGNPLWWPIAGFDLLMTRLTEIFTGIQLHPSAQIGRGLYMPHFAGIVVGEGVVIGDNCDIYQHTTLGYSGLDTEMGGYPIIGDRVLILAGAVITGKITVGSDTLIGANTVVIKSVPDRAVVGGVPARILSYKGTFTAIHYPGMERDPNRLASREIANRVVRDSVQQ
jgi:serine O-acetyltransferase